MAIGKYVEDFAGYTTMHGFSRIVSSKATPKRIAWIIAFTTAWIFFTVHMSFVLKSYFEYPKILKTDIKLGGVPFPAITLCNLGSFDFYTVKRLSEAIKNYDEQEDFDANDTFIRGMYKFYGLLNGNSSLNEENWSFFVDKMFSRTTLAANVPTEMLSENGYQENEFIVKCTYRNKPCRFTKIFDPYFFNCYTFTAPNVTSSADEDQRMLFEGIENGFTVMLLAGTRMLKGVYNPDHEGMPGIYSKDNALSGAAGVRVVIHPPGTKPFPLREGYDIPPGRMATLSLTPGKHKRLGHPHWQCSKKYPFPKLEEQKFAGHYRRTSCEQVCIQTQIYEECKCYENTLPTEFDLLPDDDDDVMSFNYSKRMNITRQKDFLMLHDYCLTEKYLRSERNGSEEDPCKRYEKCSGTIEFHKCFKFTSPDDPTCDDKILENLVSKIRCAENMKDRVMANSTLLSQCGCHSSCIGLLYGVAYSLSQWPSQGIDGDAVAFEILEIGSTRNFSSQEKKEFYENYIKNDTKLALKDFSKINVYVPNANVFLTTEEPGMTLTQLVSDIGGQLGVWIGVSVLTMAEVLEIIILMLTVCCRRRFTEEKPEEAETNLSNLSLEEDKPKKVETHLSNFATEQV